MTRRTESFLAHYGVKGMKWGVRKDRSTAPVKVRTRTRPGQRVQATGGQNQKPSNDAIRASIAKQKARASTTDSLSTKELGDLVKRMQLEQQYAQLTPKTGSAKAKKFLADVLVNVGKQQATKAANDVAARKIAEAMKK